MVFDRLLNRSNNLDIEVSTSVLKGQEPLVKAILFFDSVKEAIADLPPEDIRVVFRFQRIGIGFSDGNPFSKTLRNFALSSAHVQRGKGPQGAGELGKGEIQICP
jgi:hypothetical protein